MGVLESRTSHRSALRAQELGDGPIDPDAPKFMKPQPAVDFVRPAEVSDQAVGRDIVAVDQHGFDQVAGLLTADPVVQCAPAEIDLGQIGCRDRDLDRAGHWKSSFAVDADAGIGAEVVGGKAKLGGVRAGQGGKLLLQRHHLRRRSGNRRLGREKSRSDEECEQFHGLDHRSPTTLPP